MPRSPPRRADRLLRAAFIAFILTGAPNGGAVAGEAPLQLEVVINDYATNLIASFVQYGDKRIGIRVADLKELGIRSDDVAARTDLVALDALSGLSYRYDEA